MKQRVAGVLFLHNIHIVQDVETNVFALRAYCPCTENASLLHALIRMGLHQQCSLKIALVSSKYG